MTWLLRGALFMMPGLLVLLSCAEARAEVLGQAPSIALGSAPVRVTLTNGPMLAARVRSLPPGHKFYLVIRRLRATGPPGVLYNLFLDLDAGATPPAEGDPRAVGAINFYAAVPPGGNAPTVSFDITENLIALVAKSGLANGLSVTIAPMETPAPDAGAVLGSVELVEES
jgi:hypothetical protein